MSMQQQRKGVNRPATAAERAAAAAREALVTRLVGISARASEIAREIEAIRQLPVTPQRAAQALGLRRDLATLRSTLESDCAAHQIPLVAIEAVRDEAQNVQRQRIAGLVALALPPRRASGGR